MIICGLPLEMEHRHISHMPTARTHVLLAGLRAPFRFTRGLSLALDPPALLVRWLPLFHFDTIAISITSATRREKRQEHATLKNLRRQPSREASAISPLHLSPHPSCAFSLCLESAIP